MMNKRHHAFAREDLPVLSVPTGRKRKMKDGKNEQSSKSARIDLQVVEHPVGGEGEKECHENASGGDRFEEQQPHGNHSQHLELVPQVTQVTEISHSPHQSAVSSLQNSPTVVHANTVEQVLPMQQDRQEEPNVQGEHAQHMQHWQGAPQMHQENEQSLSPSQTPSQAIPISPCMKAVAAVVVPATTQSVKIPSVSAATAVVLPVGTKVRILSGDFKGQLAEVLGDAKPKSNVKGSEVVASSLAMNGSNTVMPVENAPVNSSYDPSPNAPQVLASPSVHAVPEPITSVQQDQPLGEVVEVEVEVEVEAQQDGVDEGADGSGDDGVDAGADGSGDDGVDAGADGSGDDGVDAGVDGSGDDGVDAGADGSGDDGVDAGAVEFLQEDASVNTSTDPSPNAPQASTTSMASPSVHAVPEPTTSVQQDQPLGEEVEPQQDGVEAGVDGSGDNGVDAGVDGSGDDGIDAGADGSGDDGIDAGAEMTVSMEVQMNLVMIVSMQVQMALAMTVSMQVQK